MTIIPKGINIIVTMNLKREHFYLASKLKFEVEKTMGLKLDSKSRTSDLVLGRMAFVYLVKINLIKCSYEDIGILTERDHATAIHTYKQALDMIKTKYEPLLIVLQDMTICYENIRNCMTEETTTQTEAIRIHNLVNDHLSSSVLTVSQKTRTIQILINRLK